MGQRSNLMQHQEFTKKEKFLRNFSTFLSSKGKIITVFLALLFTAFIAAAFLSEFNAKKAEKATIAIEAVEEKYEEFEASKNTSNDIAMDEGAEINIVKDTAADDAKLEEIIKELDAIYSKYPSLYAGEKALFLKGNIFFDEEKYNEAYEIYKTVSEKYPKSYLVPICLNNAAICLEETEKNDEAFEIYKEITEKYVSEYPNIAHVYFSMGRLSEKKEDFTSAAEYYTILTEEYPTSNWTNLANDRIIYLKSSGKYEEVDG